VSRKQASTVESNDSTKLKSRGRAATPAPFKFRGKWRIQVTPPGGKRKTREFVKHADAIAWARGVLAGVSPDGGAAIDAAEPVESGELGGPTVATLADALESYAQLCTLSKRGAQGELNRINRFLNGAGRALIKLSEDEGKKILLRVPARPIKASLLKLTNSRRELRKETYAQIARLATMRCADIKTSDVRRLKVAMEAEGLSDSTVQKEIALLKVIFRTARDEWGWEGFVNPCTAIKLGKSQRRFVHLSAAEEGALARAIAECDNPYIEPLVFIARETTLRRGTLLSIRWSDIDIEHRSMLLQTKTGQRKYVFTEVVRDIFQKLKNSVPANPADDRVFPTSLNAVTSAWKRLRERADLPNLHFKDLRHLGATNWVRRGLGTHELKAVLGHSSIATAQFYVDLVGEDQLAAIDRAMANVTALRLPNVAEDAKRAMHHSKSARLNQQPSETTVVTAVQPYPSLAIPATQDAPSVPTASAISPVFVSIPVIGYRLPISGLPQCSYAISPQPIKSSQQIS